MRVTEVRAHVAQWEGKRANFLLTSCTNPTGLVTFREASIGNVTFLRRRTHAS
jgi:hypothetical protein